MSGYEEKRQGYVMLSEAKHVKRQVNMVASDASLHSIPLAMGLLNAFTNGIFTQHDTWVSNQS